MAAPSSRALIAAVLAAAALSPAPPATAGENTGVPSVSAAGASERGRFISRCGSRNIQKLMAAMASAGGTPPAAESASTSPQEQDCAAASLSLDSERAARSVRRLAGGASSVGSERSPELVGDLQQSYQEGDLESLQARGRQLQEESAAGRQLRKVLERGDQDAQALAGGADRLREIERRAAADISDDGVLRHESCRQLPLQQGDTEPQSCLARAEIRDYQCDLRQRIRISWEGSPRLCSPEDPSSWTRASHDEGGREDRVGLRVPCEYVAQDRVVVEFAATEGWRRCGSLPVYQSRQLEVGASAQQEIRASFGARNCQSVRVQARLECGLGGTRRRCRIQASFSRIVEVAAPHWHNSPTVRERRVIGSVDLNFSRPAIIPLIQSSWDGSSCSLFEGLTEGGGS